MLLTIDTANPSNLLQLQQWANENGYSKNATPLERVRPFGPTSPWNTVLPVTTKYGGPVAGVSGIYGWLGGVPIFWAKDTDPMTTFNLPYYSWGWPGGRITVPCPTTFAGSSGTDKNAVLVTGGWVIEFWQAAKQSDGSWSAKASAMTSLGDSGWGNVSIVSVGAGIRSVGCSQIGGCISVRDCENKKIDHALALTGVASIVSSGQFVFPAIAGDHNVGTGSIKYGQRIGIPPTAIKPKFKTVMGGLIWDALCIYGCYLVDWGGGSAPVFAAENLAIIANLDLGDSSGLYWPFANGTNDLGTCLRALQLIS